ncbi:SIMPL domain-containing protein [Inmirania thermothiophila]|uniref:Uncharacterized protein YggE n=1 Tax=Inmirania thermothiophila TaxID=1750597 RepID=A0A3N1Y2C5_9GAMM|nr:SIMPL domain-containing protein [Inmirania thermothiophila]ROR32681.1 uncharacterized protein YggE [Inmirania thermothiophila]
MRRRPRPGILLAAALLAPLAAAEPPSGPRLELAATAAVEAVPDRVVLRLEAAAEGARREDAVAAAEDAGRALRRALAGLGETRRAVRLDRVGLSAHPLGDPRAAPPARWRATLALRLEAPPELLPRLEALLARPAGAVAVTGQEAALGPQARRAAEDAAAREAVRVLQRRAAAVACALGGYAAAPARVRIATGGPAGPGPLRALAAEGPVLAAESPVEVTVRAEGEFVLAPGGDCP